MLPRVVIDTTAIREIKGRLLAGPDSDLLMVGVRKLGIEVLVPRVVMEEAVNQFRREVEKRSSEIAKNIEALKRYLPDPTGIGWSGFDAEAATKDYSDRLGRRIGELGASVVEYTNFPHSGILKRAMERRKPFSETGKGYQDTLIWESVLLHSEERRKIILITGNTHDFCDKSGALHADLARDLITKGLDPDSVSVCQTISDFNQKYVTPYLEPIAPATRDGASEWQFRGFSFTSFFNSQLSELIDYVRFYANDSGDEIAALFGVRAAISNVYLQSFGEFGDIITTEVFRIDGERAGLILDFGAEGRFEADIHRSDLADILSQNTVTVSDKSLNSHSVTINFELRMEFAIDLVLKADSGELLQYAIVHFDLSG